MGLREQVEMIFKHKEVFMAGKSDNKRLDKFLKDFIEICEEPVYEAILAPSETESKLVEFDMVLGSKSKYKDEITSKLDLEDGGDTLFNYLKQGAEILSQLKDSNPRAENYEYLKQGGGKKRILNILKYLDRYLEEMIKLIKAQNRFFSFSGLQRRFASLTEGPMHFFSKPKQATEKELQASIIRGQALLDQVDSESEDEGLGPDDLVKELRARYERVSTELQNKEQVDKPRREAITAITNMANKILDRVQQKIESSRTKGATMVVGVQNILDGLNDKVFGYYRRALGGDLSEVGHLDEELKVSVNPLFEEKTVVMDSPLYEPPEPTQPEVDKESEVEEELGVDVQMAENPLYEGKQKDNPLYEPSEAAQPKVEVRPPLPEYPSQFLETEEFDPVASLKSGNNLLNMRLFLRELTRNKGNIEGFNFSPQAINFDAEMKEAYPGNYWEDLLDIVDHPLLKDKERIKYNLSELLNKNPNLRAALTVALQKTLDKDTGKLNMLGGFRASEEAAEIIAARKAKK